MKRAVTVAVLVAAMLAVPAMAGVIDSGVSGTVTLGPTRPVCRVDEPCSRPYATRVVVRNANTGRRVAVVNSDDRGRFRVRLRPGAYRLRAAGGRPLPSCQAVSLRVHRHRFTRVTLDCDTGIR
jgi:hypothetical protein